MEKICLFLSSLVLKIIELSNLIQVKQQIIVANPKMQQKKVHDKKCGLVQLNFMQNSINTLN